MYYLVLDSKKNYQKDEVLATQSRKLSRLESIVS